jgi:hypothetical protein
LQPKQEASGNERGEGKKENKPKNILNHRRDINGEAQKLPPSTRFINCAVIRHHVKGVPAIYSIESL